jgi:hypothetical protein
MKKTAKKLIKRTLIYLVVLTSIPYFYLVWQAKGGVDTFLATHNLQGDFNYDWLWVDLDGYISLSNVSFYQQDYDPIFEAELLSIKLPSVFDFINSKEKVVYKEFPTNISVSLLDAKTIKTPELLQLFGVNHIPAMLPLFFPNQCREVLYNELPNLQFSLSTNFSIYRTADDVVVDFDFSNSELTNATGQFRVNNFSDINSDASFISDLSLKFSEVYLVQQNTQKCLQSNPLERKEFIQSVAENIEKTSKDYRLLVNKDSANIIGEFIFAPQKVELVFDLQEGKTFSQIDLKPYHQLQQKLGLKISLNEKPVGDLFKAFNYIAPSVSQDNQQKPTSKVVEKNDNWISVNVGEIRKYLGAKVRITLYEGQPAEGYIERVTTRQLELRQLKYKGESILPYAMKDIKSIFLLVKEK